MRFINCGNIFVEIALPLVMAIHEDNYGFWIAGKSLFNIPHLVHDKEK